LLVALVESANRSIGVVLRAVGGPSTRVNTVKQSLSAVLPKGSLTNKANLLDLGAEIRLLADADGALYRAWR
jgi:hypothetical protein